MLTKYLLNIILPNLGEGGVMSVLYCLTVLSHCTVSLYCLTVADHV